MWVNYIYSKVEKKNILLKLKISYYYKGNFIRKKKSLYCDFFFIIIQNLLTQLNNSSWQLNLWEVSIITNQMVQRSVPARL